MNRSARLRQCCHILLHVLSALLLGSNSYVSGKLLKEYFPMHQLHHSQYFFGEDKGLRRRISFRKRNGEVFFGNYRLYLCLVQDE